MPNKLDGLKGSLRGAIECVDTRVVSPLVERISGAVRATVKHLFGTIDTPLDLKLSLEKHVRKLTEYTPYLREADANSPCLASDLHSQPFMNPMTTTIEPREERMRAEAGDHTRFYLWLIMKQVEDYLSDEHPQRYRISIAYSKFVDELMTAKRRDLPEIATRFVKQIEGLT